MKPYSLIALLALWLLPTGAIAETSVQNQIVRATLIAKTTGIVPGEPLVVGVRLQPQEGWHTYWQDPGDAGIPTTLEWTLPEGFIAGEIEWPPYTKLTEGTLSVNAYVGEVVLPVTISTPSTLDTSGHYTIKVHAEWLVCHDICIPEAADLDLTLPVGVPVASDHAGMFPEKKAAPATAINETATPATDVAPAKAKVTAMAAPLFVALLLSALLGGLILNLMPCVLPVLSLKALALVKKSQSAPHVARRHGLAYTLGIMVSFTGFAMVLIALRHAGASIGWGFQMQSPPFVGFLFILIYLVGLNLSGMFTLPVLLGNVGTQITTDDLSMRGSFFTGVLATAVATPCTAPFMASAVGLALTLPSWQGLLVFEALAFGLALPFLLIACFPKVLRLLPKPGAWMETFRQFLAFGMYGSAIWLLWVLTLQVGAGGMVVAVSAALLLTAVIWLKALFKPDSALYHGLGTLLALAVLICALSSLGRMAAEPVAALSNPAGAEIETYSYSKDKLAELRASGKTVLVDATAAWCITCQLNAKVAIHTDRVTAAFKQQGAVLMVADWTRRNAEITEFLTSFGYNGVPLYVVYAPGKEPQVLPQLLSEDTVINAISK